MFGYHNSGACSFDIWAPGTRTGIENRAYSAYCKHITEIENIIEDLVAQAQQGIYDTFIETDENLTEKEIEYIKEEVRHRTCR